MFPKKSLWMNKQKAKHGDLLAPPLRGDMHGKAKDLLIGRGRRHQKGRNRDIQQVPKV